MKSPRQLQASRVNSAKSRGPVTAEGKRNTSQNAIRHGAFCKAILLKTESKSEFAEFAQSLRDEFQPRTAFESTLVDDMIAARWRAMRFAIMEESLVDHEIDKTEKQIRDGVMGDDAVLEAPAVAALSFRSLADDSRSLDLLIRYGSHFGRQYLRAHKRLIEVQDRRGKTPPPPSHPKSSPSASRLKNTKHRNNPSNSLKIEVSRLRNAVPTASLSQCPPPKSSVSSSPPPSPPSPPFPPSPPVARTIVFRRLRPPPKPKPTSPAQQKPKRHPPKPLSA